MDETPRQIVAQYCDDVRQEVGNKYSLMGCYGAELFVPSFPVVLPKLCAQVKVLTSSDQPFERVTMRAYLNAELIAELEFPSDQLQNRPANFEPISEVRRIVALGVLAFAPLQIQEPNTTLRVDAETETGTIRGMPLRILKAPEPAKP